MNQNEQATPQTISRRATRIVGIAFGVGSQLLVAVCAWRLFWFLHGDSSNGRLMEGPWGPTANGGFALLIDAALLLQFSISHSLLMLPAIQTRLKRFLRGEFYGCLYASATCLSLLLLIACWRTSPPVLWQLRGTAATAVHVGYYLSWVALIYSLGLTGFGYQTGWTPWRHWLLGRTPPRRTFVPRGAYTWMRHPVYASVLGLIWFTPGMTLDHALMTALWTVYLFYGSHLKDERLAYYLGADYRRYQAAVTGYPLFPFGPLARRAFFEESSEEPSVAAPSPTADDASTAAVVQRAAS
ncbi:MAG: hypothetical protein RIC55_24035 [Pirellulaceae bacterium]